MVRSMLTLLLLLIFLPATIAAVLFFWAVVLSLVLIAGAAGVFALAGSHVVGAVLGSDYSGGVGRDLGMPAPDGSLIVPAISPEEPTPCACTELTATIGQSKNQAHFIRFIGPPSMRASLQVGKAVVRCIPHKEANSKHYVGTLVIR